MLPKRLPIRTPILRTYIFKKYSMESGKSGSEGVDVPEKNSDNEPADAKKNEITDKINLILKSMVADNAKRGSEPFKSKFPIDNKGFKRQTEKPKEGIIDLKETQVNFKKAATAVAESLGDEGKQIENDLVAKVLDIQKPVSVNWSELISGMNVDHADSSPKDAPFSSRAQEVHSALSRSKDRTQYRQKFPSDTEIKPFVRRDKVHHKRYEIKPIDLFGSEPLGIFNETTTDNGTEVKLWDYLKENELRIAITHPPANYFQKMILWTNQGKLWKFPIDNEQGLQGETDVHFSEHIFLETHLEGWCPRKGPVRHFMELVCVGLSKNPYMPVQEKRDHINWFKEYFDSKKDLLQQVGALPDMLTEKQQQLSK